MTRAPTRGKQHTGNARAFRRRAREKRATFRWRATPSRHVLVMSLASGSVTPRGHCLVLMKARSRLHSLPWLLLPLAGAICCTRLESGADTFGVMNGGATSAGAGTTTGAQAG